MSGGSGSSQGEPEQQQELHRVHGCRRRYRSPFASLSELQRHGSPVLGGTKCGVSALSMLLCCCCGGCCVPYLMPRGPEGQDRRYTRGVRACSLRVRGIWPCFSRSEASRDSSGDTLTHSCQLDRPQRLFLECGRQPGGRRLSLGKLQRGWKRRSELLEVCATRRIPDSESRI